MLAGEEPADVPPEPIEEVTDQCSVEALAEAHEVVMQVTETHEEAAAECARGRQAGDRDA